MQVREKRNRVISALLMATMAMVSAVAFLHSASARLTGRYTKFQHLPYDNFVSEFSDITVALRRSRQAHEKAEAFEQQALLRLLTKFFESFNCYVSLITKTVRGAYQPARTDQTGLGLLSRLNPITHSRAIENQQTGIEFATKKANGITNLTFSAA